MNDRPTVRSPLTRVFQLWFPLMASWALMGIELPMITGVLARLPDSETELAATSGIVFPLSLLIEAPIIMLLSASTALVDDRKTEAWLRAFVIASAVVLTLVHAALALTPLYDLVVGDLLGVSERLHASGRLGLALSIPWSGAIAWRRFRQGILIRAERSGEVGKGTAVRLVTGVTVLGAGALIGITWPGLALPGAGLAGLTLGCGVLAEAVYAEWRARPVVRERLANDDDSVTALDLRRFFAFYAPLAVTPFLTLGIQPLASGTMSRMPLAIESLACFGPVYGLVFMLRSAGFAFQEVVVSFARDKQVLAALHIAARRVAGVVTLVIGLLAFGPVGEVWFGRLAGLEADLVPLALQGMAVAVGFPALSVYLHLGQGQLVAQQRTRQITVGVVLYVVLAVAGLTFGAAYDWTAGLPWCIGTLFFAGACQTVWLNRAARTAPG